MSVTMDFCSSKDYYRSYGSGTSRFISNNPVQLSVTFDLSQDYSGACIMCRIQTFLQEEGCFCEKRATMDTFVYLDEHMSFIG